MSGAGVGRIVLAAAVGFGLLAGATARADEPAPIPVAIKNHQFSPAEIHVPTGKAVTLKITNEDPTAEEFDSTALKVEKVIVGGA